VTRRPRHVGDRATAATLATCATLATMVVAVLANRSILPMLAVGFLIVTPLERLRPRRRQPLVPRAAFVNLAHATVTTSLTTALLASAVAMLSLLPTIDATARWFAGVPAPVALALIVLVGDVGYYWVHRAMHQVPLLWRFHRIHHSSEEMGWLAAARAHPVDQLLLHLGWLVPLHLLGARSAWFGAYAALLTMQTLLVHSNVDVGVGPLRRVLVTPDFHHWHHTAERRAWNRNFASQLAVLDRLFGTSWLPRGERACTYGVGEPVAASYPGQLLEPVTARADRRD
jgi:sterol desaturase/sphingolipid hydroxylase (fatty acid hydroxylase superfamily)